LCLCEDCGVVVGPDSRWCRPCCRKHVSQSLKGRPKTEEHKRKIAAAHLNVPDPLHYGPNNRRWKGGTPNWRGFAWRIQRRRAKERDGHECRRCPATTGLSVHHVKKPQETGGEWDNRLENLETLCRSCHGKHHGAESHSFECRCRFCGASFIAGNPVANTCSSPGCRTRSHTEAHQRWVDRKFEPFVCGVCGKEFPRRQGRRRYCSEECAEAGRARRMSAYNKEYKQRH
jgi:5-methylcytosine-specific restriction endonuclease McrA